MWWLIVGFCCTEQHPLLTATAQVSFSWAAGSSQHFKPIRASWNLSGRTLVTCLRQNMFHDWNRSSIMIAHTGRQLLNIWLQERICQRPKRSCSRKRHSSMYIHRECTQRERKTQPFSPLSWACVFWASHTDWGRGDPRCCSTGWYYSPSPAGTTSWSSNLLDKITSWMLEAAASYSNLLISVDDVILHDFLWSVCARAE